MLLNTPQRLALATCRVLRRIPRIRGRNRALLAILARAKLNRPQTKIRSSLWRPVRYEAELDLGSWLQRLAFVDGGYESALPPFLGRLWACHPERGVVLDAGANVGLITLPLVFLLRRLRAGAPCVAAIEPVSSNLEALRRNLELNRIDKEVLVLGCGVGSQDEPAWIHVEGGLGAGGGSGTANILPATLGAGEDGQPIRVRTIDSLVLEGVLPECVTVMKLDTDGYDLKVLQGAESVLQHRRPFVFGEFTDHCLRWHGQSVQEVEALARDLGYQVFVRQGGCFNFTMPSREGELEDLLLLPRELVSRVTSNLPGLLSI